MGAICIGQLRLALSKDTELEKMMGPVEIIAGFRDGKLTQVEAVKAIKALVEAERERCATELERLTGACSSEEVIRTLMASSVYLRKTHQPA